MIRFKILIYLEFFYFWRFYYLYIKLTKIYYSYYNNLYTIKNSQKFLKIQMFIPDHFEVK